MKQSMKGFLTLVRTCLHRMGCQQPNYQSMQAPLGTGLQTLENEGFKTKGVGQIKFEFRFGSKAAGELPAWQCDAGDQIKRNTQMVALMQ